MTRTYDLFVVGGGINGAAITCDAAGRGLAVGLAEMLDLGEGTSSRSSKIIHGGLRYLETYDFRLVRHALKEREILMAKAPHLVWPMRLVLPHVPGQRPRWMIRLGLFLYDHLARRRVLAASEAIDLHDHPSGQPLDRQFRHAFAYSDCRCDDARLVIANVLAAHRHGADIHARHRFIASERQGELWHIELENLRDGTRVEVAARALVNAAGPWVIDVVGRTRGVKTQRRLRMVRGSHVVVPRQWPGEHGYFLQTHDGRLMEIFPYETDFMSVGTTDEPWDEDPARVRISDAEIDYMLEEVNRFLARPIVREDIVWSYSGVRPLFEVGGARDGDLSTLTRDYSFEIDHAPGEAPALTVFGGKLTTHRRLAEHAMKELCKIMPWPARGITRQEILPGGDFGAAGVAGVAGYQAALCQRHPWLPVSQAQRYVRQYGVRSDELLDGVDSLDAMGRFFGHDLYQREVDFLVATEWACTLDDVIWRRSKLGLRLTDAEKTVLAAYIEEASGWPR